MPVIPAAKRRGSFRLRVLTAVFALLLAFLVRQAWPEGREMLQRILLPGEPTVTEAALDDMVEEIQAGEPIGDALTAFCRQIVEHGAQEAY